MQRSAGRKFAAEGDFVRLPLHPQTADEKGEFKGVILENLLKDKNLSPGPLVFSFSQMVSPLDLRILQLLQVIQVKR